MAKIAPSRRHQSQSGTEQTLRELAARDDGVLLPVLERDPPSPQHGAAWIHGPSRTLRVRIRSTTYKTAALFEV